MLPDLPLTGDAPAEIGEVVPEADPSEETAEEVYETYLCDSCEFNSKSLAGLKAHGRAKHPE
jgi:hypothetical protein